MAEPATRRPRGRPPEPVPVSETLGHCVVADDSGRRIRELLDRVGDKWSVMIIIRLKEGGAMRFGELTRAVGGISQRMLTLNLRQLQRDGLLTRTTYAEVPARVEYQLTPLGLTLTGPVIALATWALDNYASIEQHRADFDADNPAPRPKG